VTTGQTSLRERYRGQQILLTGASGLLGQAVLEKLLRALPEVGQVFLLMRARGRTSSHERIPEVLGSPLFRRLRHERPDFDAWWPTKITTVTGALGLERFGLTPDDWRTLAEQVTAVIHVGAVASFDEPLDRVLEVNTAGALYVLELARQAGDVPMVHVSTCYVCGNSAGMHREKLIPWGHTPRSIRAGANPTFDPEAELGAHLRRSRQLRLDVEAGLHDEVVTRALPDIHLSGERLEVLRREYADERLGRMGTRVANRLGWPDPYPMSKAWAEQLLARDMGSVPLSIVRPAILASTLAEPEPGWLTGLRMADPMVVAMGRGVLDRFPGDPMTILDLVPCDLAANTVLAALPERGPLHDPHIYQVAGSDKNPLALGDFERICHTALASDPFRDQHGVCLEPSRVELVDYPRFQRILSRHRRVLALKLAVFEGLGMVERARSLRVKLRFLRYAHLLGRAYAPYTVRYFHFATAEADRLSQQLCPEERDLFPMDVGSVDWVRYLTEAHVPAVRREAGETSGADDQGARFSQNGHP
jgi:nucleoside-diphosphate-sugar epimerase